MKTFIILLAIYTFLLALKGVKDNLKKKNGKQMILKETFDEHDVPEEARGVIKGILLFLFILAVIPVVLFYIISSQMFTILILKLLGIVMATFYIGQAIKLSGMVMKDKELPKQKFPLFGITTLLYVVFFIINIL